MSDARLWHVKITVAGPETEPFVVRRAMQRLAEERPFLESLRYGPDRAEICSGEEGVARVDAGPFGLRVWPEHRDSARLPPWDVVGLEVREREIVHTSPLLDSLTDLHVVPILF